MQLNLNTTNNKTYNTGSRKDQKPEVIERSFGMDFTETVNIIFLGILLACLLTAVIVYLLGGSLGSPESGGDSASVRANRGPSFSGKVEKKLYAERDILVNSPTIDGIMVELLNNYVLGYDEPGETEEAETSVISTDDPSAQAVDDAGTIITTNEPDAGETVTQAGASMILDGGQGMEGYTEAASHEELVTQLETALAANDYDFVGMKLAYKDDYGDLKGYPQSVVSHFTEYMSANAGKRGDFISRIKDQSFSAVNDSAYIVVLPVIKFTVNMAYDDTTVSVPGFGDQIVNSGQSAVIQPLLPCMYTVTLSNAGWSQPVTKEIETSLDELSYSLSVS